MTVKDFPPRPAGADADSVEHMKWLDKVSQRQNIDDQILAVTVSSADETYLFSVSASATRKCTVSQITALANVLNDQILIQDQKNNGVNGNAYTLGAWRTVVLNTKVTDTGSNVVSLASNAFALKAGSYEFEAEVNAGFSANANAGRLRLRNTTDGTTVAQGVNLTLDDTPVGLAEDDFMLSVRGSTVIAAQKTFELQVWTTATTGASVAISTGDKEIYASLWLRRYA